MKVYFICHPLGTPDKAAYQHQVVVLAEGLKELGIEFWGNINYWLQSEMEGDYLIRQKEGVNLNDFDLVVFASQLFDYDRLDLLPENIFDRNREFTSIFLDCSDFLITPGYDKRMRAVDYVLKSQYNQKYTHPSNFVPWQFGPSSRIINSAQPLPFEQRNNCTVSNFRILHNLRAHFDKNVMPLVYEHYPENSGIPAFDADASMPEDYIFWQQTGRRHNPAYYRALGANKVVNAVSGYAQKEILTKQNQIVRIVTKVEEKLNILPYDRVYQFDSWRFWESLVSGSLTMHVDFDKFGIKLPVMPQNKEHYLGVDLNNVNGIRDVLESEDAVTNIAASGREWVLKHYSPKATTERLSQMLDA